MSFTQAELDAMKAADAEIEADFHLTPEEIAAARDRDERAIFEATRKKPLTDKDRERAKAYYQAHREERIAYRLRYYRANRESVLAHKREYYQAHKSECNARNNERRKERYHSEPEYAERMREKARRNRERKQAKGCG